MKKIQESNIISRLNGLLPLLFFFSFIFGVRYLVGLTTVLMAATALLAYRLESGRWWNPDFFNVFVSGLFLYFGMQAIALYYTRNLPEGFSAVRINLGMIALPVALLYSHAASRQSFKRWKTAYVYMLLAATLLALVHAGLNFSAYHDSAVFFYHPLVRIYSGQAIQFSVIVFLGILILMEEYAGSFSRKYKAWMLLLLSYFSLFLFLLSSKLVLVIYFLYGLYVMAFSGIFFRRVAYRFAGLLVVVSLAVCAVVTDNPFSRRIREEADARISLIRQPRFDPGDYFTGVQFRLLTWRFVYEILNEKHAWVTGVSPGDAQDALAEKYKRENMFTGGVPENETGYLGLHSHNQFLQAVLETGIFGLIFFIVVCVGLIRMARSAGSVALWVLVLLSLCNCFTDAPLKTQYGIILFVFFPLFVYRENEQEIPAG